MKPHFTNTGNPIDFPKTEKMMNERIKELAREAGYGSRWTTTEQFEQFVEKFAELIVRECANICMEMAAKCAGLPGDGALAKDCAYWIKKDFGVEE